MLGNIIYFNPTKLYFGEEAPKYLEQVLKGYGTKILLVYGGGSIKKNGIYDQMISVLKNTGKQTVEISDVMPNPTTGKLYEGAKLARENDADFIFGFQRCHQLVH